VPSVEFVIDSRLKSRLISASYTRFSTSFEGDSVF